MIVKLFFFYFSKAFDTVDHTILLKKLHKLGIRDLAYAWIKSYLIDRKLFLSFNNVTSSNKTITYGVPQGSILGQALFWGHKELSKIIEWLHSNKLYPNVNKK